jgi:hypothetical protein
VGDPLGPLFPYSSIKPPVIYNHIIIYLVFFCIITLLILVINYSTPEATANYSASCGRLKNFRVPEATENFLSQLQLIQCNTV